MLKNKEKSVMYLIKYIIIYEVINSKSLISLIIPNKFMKDKLESLVRVKKKHIPLAVETFVKAFYDDPLAIYMFGKESDRSVCLRNYFNFRIKYGVLFGEVYASSLNFEGLAVWISNENIKMTNWKMVRAGGMKLFSKMGSGMISKMMEIEKYTSEIHHHYVNIPHWHLTPIGVNPEHQGKGYGSTLMRAMLNRFDKDKIACFLETQSKKNVEIYKRYGFEIVEEGIIPKVNLQHWAMIRYPVK